MFQLLIIGKLIMVYQVLNTYFSGSYQMIMNNIITLERTIDYLKI